MSTELTIQRSGASWRWAAVAAAASAACCADDTGASEGAVVTGRRSHSQMGDLSEKPGWGVDSSGTDEADAPQAGPPPSQTPEAVRRQIWLDQQTKYIEDDALGRIDEAVSSLFDGLPPFLSSFASTVANDFLKSLVNPDADPPEYNVTMFPAGSWPLGEGIDWDTYEPPGYFARVAIDVDTADVKGFWQAEATRPTPWSALRTALAFALVQAGVDFIEAASGYELSMVERGLVNTFLNALLS